MSAEGSGNCGLGGRMPVPSRRRGRGSTPRPSEVSFPPFASRVSSALTRVPFVSSQQRNPMGVRWCHSAGGNRERMASKHGIDPEERAWQVARPMGRRGRRAEGTGRDPEYQGCSPAPGRGAPAPVAPATRGTQSAALCRRRWDGRSTPPVVVRQLCESSGLARFHCWQHPVAPFAIAARAASTEGGPAGKCATPARCERKSGPPSADGEPPPQLSVPRLQPRPRSGRWTGRTRSTPSESVPSRQCRVPTTSSRRRYPPSRPLPPRWGPGLRDCPLHGDAQGRAPRAE